MLFRRIASSSLTITRLFVFSWCVLNSTLYKSIYDSGHVTSQYVQKPTYPLYLFSYLLYAGLPQCIHELSSSSWNLPQYLYSFHFIACLFIQQTGIKSPNIIIQSFLSGLYSKDRMEIGLSYTCVLYPWLNHTVIPILLLPSYH